MGKQGEHGIAWCDFSFNTHWGCTRVSEGCAHCYAETLSERFGHGIWGPEAGRKPMSESYWKQLDKWQRQTERTGERPKVFCNSMSDLFEGPETCQDAAAYAVVRDGRERLFDNIERTPNLTYLLLTKRIQNVLTMTPMRWQRGGFPPNVWVGTSVENQARADERIPELLKIPATVRFLSVEPLLGPLYLGLEYYEPSCENTYARLLSRGGYLHDRNASHPCDHACNGLDVAGGIDWVIVGGESGPGARPMHPHWARRLRDECEVGGVAFFFKQNGEYLYGDFRNDGEEVELLMPMKVGKHAAGRLLDGRTWDEMPEIQNRFTGNPHDRSLFTEEVKRG